MNASTGIRTMARSVAQTSRMDPLSRTAAIPVALHAKMVITNPAAAVFRTIVQRVRQRVQTTAQQVRSRPAMGVYGEVKKLVRATIRAMVQEQIVAAVSMEPSNAQVLKYRPVQPEPGTVAKHVKRRQVEQRHALAMVIVDIHVIPAIQIMANSAV